MEGAVHPTILGILAGLVIVTILAKDLLERFSLPPLIGFLLLGLLLRLAHDETGVLSASGVEALHGLGKLGVAVLLFRIGLESDLKGLLGQLRSASLIWVGNVAASAALGYLAARYLLSLPLIPSFVVATAMTATSVGIPSQVWRDAGALDSADGERFLDVAELDDISGVLLMAILFAVLPALRDPQQEHLLGLVGHVGGAFVFKLAVFGAVCYLYSRYLERHVTRFLGRHESQTDLMLVVASTGILTAALAGMLGFSMAIGAFFAGVTYSRDPEAVHVDASFSSLYELFSPFFFISVGFSIAPDALTSALGAGSVLLVAAAAGKVLGAGVPALVHGSLAGALVLGISMVPRAEITMLMMQRGRTLGDAVVSDELYAAMILVAAATSVIFPVLLRMFLGRLESAG